MTEKTKITAREENGKVVIVLKKSWLGRLKGFFQIFFKRLGVFYDKLFRF